MSDIYAGPSGPKQPRMTVSLALAICCMDYGANNPSPAPEGTELTCPDPKCKKKIVAKGGEWTYAK